MEGHERSPGNRARCGRENLEEDENRRGERRRGRLTTDFDERFDPWNKASKSGFGRVAAGQPVSAFAVKARGQRPVMSWYGCGSGETPERKPWTWLWGEINPRSRRWSKPSRG
jgi:hypothetical protein